jgi:hypothetical protein
MSIEQPQSHHAEALQARLRAERRGTPFLVFREEGGSQRIMPLPASRQRVTIGRRSGNDLALTWDPEVSGLHAALELLGSDWTLIDDGLSRNGSYVNGSRLTGRRRLKDGDALRFGKTAIIYRQPSHTPTTYPTATPRASPPTRPLSDTQRRVLIALCRPLRESAHASPATNREIAQQLFLSVDAVKVHLRALYERFAIQDLPQNRKRARLAALALESGLVSPRDLWD